MANTQAASVIINNSTGLSGIAYLDGSEVVINLAASATAQEGVAQAQVQLISQTGQVFRLFLAADIKAPKVDAPTVMTQITGVKLSDSSFQITSSGISDADGEIASLLYIATNTRTSQQLVSSNGRFDNLDWGDWVVVATGMAKNGATGALTSVRNDRSDLVYRFTRENPDPAPVAPAGSAFANLGNMTVSDAGGFPL